MVAVINAAFAVENFLDGTRTDHERLAETMAKGHFLLGCDSSGQILASVYIEVCDGRGCLGMLAVHPGHQRKGLGRALVHAAEQHCRERGCKAMDLKVLSLRSELPPLYRKLGYLECGTEEFHPSRPLKSGVECHCIVMSKAL
jgi:GNAT superfamily N-acetyltransferase